MRRALTRAPLAVGDITRAYFFFGGGGRGGRGFPLNQPQKNTEPPIIKRERERERERERDTTTVSQSVSFFYPVNVNVSQFVRRHQSKSYSSCATGTRLPSQMVGGHNPSQMMSTKGSRERTPYVWVCPCLGSPPQNWWLVSPQNHAEKGVPSHLCPVFSQNSHSHFQHFLFGFPPPPPHVSCFPPTIFRDFLLIFLPPPSIFRVFCFSSTKTKTKTSSQQQRIFLPVFCSHYIYIYIYIFAGGGEDSGSSA